MLEEYRAPADETMLNEAGEVDWRRYLATFREEVWPIFEQQGVSFDAALNVWWLNRVMNQLNGVMGALVLLRGGEEDHGDTYDTG